MSNNIENECITPIQEDHLLEEKEMVNSPSHYIICIKEDGTNFEAIDLIQHILNLNSNLTPFQGGLLFNCIKYVCRTGQKDKVLQELKKSQYYLNRLITNLEDG